MGQISGVNASSITSISGVAVSNISYVGPVSAATIGLGGGGGGKVFTYDTWDNPTDACLYGQRAIDKQGSQTLYQNGDYFYTDSTFETPFPGKGAWYWCQTDNTSYAIGETGDIKNSSSCVISTDLVFTVNSWDDPSTSCIEGQEYINAFGSQTLYKNGEYLYLDSSFMAVFSGENRWWWCQTNNQSYFIGYDGYIMQINAC